MTNDHLAHRDTPIAVGDEAPDFTLLDQNRAEWKLSDHLDGMGVVLCFYPMDFTDVCQSEMTCITSEMQRWSQRKLQVVGVSCDSFAVHKAWAQQMGYQHPLLADMHRNVVKAYGLLWPELNVSKRATVVVGKDEDGTPRVRWIQVREPGNAMDFDEVLAHSA